MTTGQKWGFGLGIGALVIGLGVLAYFYSKEKKMHTELRDVVTPPPVNAATLVAVENVAAVTEAAATARKARQFSA